MAQHRKGPEMSNRYQNVFNQGTLTEGEGSVLETSSLLVVVLQKKKKISFRMKRAYMN
jgi:hypothetical protein